jgi:hypothetical protein
MLTGTGDCDTFVDAVIQAITYQQEHVSQHTLVATLARYTLETVATLGESLRRTRKVRPTLVLYLYLGAQGWIESMQAYELVVKSRSMELSWDAYLEDGQGPDPAGIYLFGSDGARTVALMSSWKRPIHHNEARSTSSVKRSKGSLQMGGTLFVKHYKRELLTVV